MIEIWSEQFKNVGDRLTQFTPPTQTQCDRTVRIFWTCSVSKFSVNDSLELSRIQLIRLTQTRRDSPVLSRRRQRCGLDINLEFGTTLQRDVSIFRTFPHSH